ncbi:magnesium transporter MRS2-11, chloroplastic isoform X3 [Magnolia sinica]|uniref:magnesium transporter MRS2-11, chloroplastic isoform X3 n=1 Tax=Magnolia sinica TaxID=86752 RepID=UPI002659D42A|nr:magnesium transporter MRS2-11, chloroplastic isoform X3 [Magnolia sinica]
MAFSSHCSLLQNPSLSLSFSSSESHLLLISDFVSCRLFRSSHISFRRNINSPIFPTNPSFLLCAASSDKNLADSAKEKSGDGQSLAEREWGPVEPAPSSDLGPGPGPIARNSMESISLGIKEPVYEVIEVRSDGIMSKKKINRRQLLKSSGLRPRDIRSVDPSLWLTNSMPSLLVVEAALLSRIQRLEQRLMDVEPQVLALLEVLPNRLTANVLEQLRISKQTLVELGSRAGALKQMLLDLLEDPHEIRRICIMGRNCTVRKGNNEMECSVPTEKQIAEEEEEEIEMLLENYLQRCESCHGQAERLLDSAREMEDSIAVNLSSRRLEVSRVELLLQVGTFCVAIGALVAGIFGMNLKSYLEEHVWAFWLTTAGIIVGGVAAFFIMYSYLKSRRIL